MAKWKQSDKERDRLYHRLVSTEWTCSVKISGPLLKWLVPLSSYLNTCHSLKCIGKWASQGSQEQVWAWVIKFFGHPSKGGPSKHLYTKLWRSTLSCRVTWVWSERVNLKKQQIMILLRKTKTYATQLSHRPLLDCWALIFVYWLPPPLMGNGAICWSVC